MRGSQAAVAVSVALTLSAQHGMATGQICLPHTPQSIFWSYSDEESKFSLVYGHFKDVRKLQHNYDKKEGRTEMIWGATFVGARPSSSGFNIPFTTYVEVEDAYYEIFLPGKPISTKQMEKILSSRDVLVYLEHTSKGYRVNFTASCVWDVNADPASVSQALDCVNGRNCPRPRSDD